MKLKYTSIDVKNESELRFIAETHIKLPLLYWDKNHVLDLDAIPIWIDYFKASEKNEKVCFIIARSGEEIVGFHWVREDERYGEKCGYIDSLWVHDDFQKLGIAKTLKMKGEDWARERGYSFITTDVNYSNKRMIEYNLKNN